MQLADGVFCREVGAEDGGRAGGRSLRSTLIVLIGLLRTEEHGIDHPFHIGALRAKLLSELGAEELTAGDFGLALWAESRADGGASMQLLNGLRKRLDGGRLGRLDTVEAAWILIGLVESGARQELAAADGLLREVRGELLDRRQRESGLLSAGGRARRRFATFADQIAGLQALSLLARVMDDGEARDAAAALGARLADGQLASGAWPWLFDARRGSVADPYPIYSANQDSIAVIGMHGAAEATGQTELRAAALRGMDWNYGQNELGAQMLDPGAGRIYRSIRRKRRSIRGSRAGSAARGYLGSGESPAKPETLEVDRTMEPSHLGWILEAWAGREELAAPSSP
jgi:hypothetical protein